MSAALTPRERELIAGAAKAQSEAEAKAAYGVKAWINDEPWEKALERLASQPTVNVQGLVAGYTGPGGKTVLPGRCRGQAGMPAGAQPDEEGGRGQAARASAEARVRRYRGAGDRRLRPDRDRREQPR